MSEKMKYFIEEENGEFVIVEVPQETRVNKKTYKSKDLAFVNHAMFIHLAISFYEDLIKKEKAKLEKILKLSEIHLGETLNVK